MLYLPSVPELQEVTARKVGGGNETLAPCNVYYTPMEKGAERWRERESRCITRKALSRSITGMGGTKDHGALGSHFHEGAGGDCAFLVVQYVKKVSPTKPSPASFVVAPLLFSRKTASVSHGVGTTRTTHRTRAADFVCGRVTFVCSSPTVPLSLSLVGCHLLIPLHS